MAAADPDSELVFDTPFLVRVYKSGRVERFIGTAVVPPGLDPATGVTSKDVLIDPSTGLSARLYLPPAPSDCPIPVLVYYHGGAFIVESAASPTYHNYLNSLAAAAGVIAVSVDYRRAPEHPLPAAYEDSWAALRWVTARPPEEPWLAAGKADLGRLFLAGDSAGGNIVHHTALRAADDGLGAASSAIEGLLLVHPYFWGETPLESETTDPNLRGLMERLWALARPGTTGTDDPSINPLAEGAPSLAVLPCRRVAVAVAERDFLRERGKAYYDALKRSGWEGEARLLEAEGEDAQHVFHLLNPSVRDRRRKRSDRDTRCAIAENLLQAFVAFLNSSD